MTSRHPRNESERLQTLSEYGILDSPPEKSYNDVTELCAKIVGAPMAVVSFIDRGREWFKSTVGIQIAEIPRGISLPAQINLAAEPLIIQDLTKENLFSSNPMVIGQPYIRFYAGFPLVTPKEHILGTLYVMDKVPRILNSLQIEILTSLSRHVMALLELRHELNQLERYTIERQKYERHLEETNAKLGLLTVTDELTGLGNRRALEDYLEYQVHQAARYGRTISIMLIDIDHFKEYNDTFGHPEGDELLRTIARLANNSTRASDLVARYGGDEFAIILPNSGKSACKILAERFRKSVEDVAMLKGPITVSIGVFSLNAANAEISDVIKEADRALYQAKRLGRNRICHADDIPVAR